jgi:hypothetical protein
MSKKTLILPLSVVYTLIDEVEGIEDGFYKFPHGEISFYEVLRVQRNKTLSEIRDGYYSEEESEDAEGGAVDSERIARNLSALMTEKGFSLSAVTGSDGVLLYKKNKVEGGKSFVAQSPDGDWDYRVAKKFADCSFDIAEYSEEYDCVMDEIEKNVFDETVDYLSVSVDVDTLPCVLCVFDGE